MITLAELRSGGKPTAQEIMWAHVLREQAQVASDSAEWDLVAGTTPDEQAQQRCAVASLHSQTGGRPLTGPVVSGPVSGTAPSSPARTRHFFRACPPGRVVTCLVWHGSSRWSR